MEQHDEPRHHWHDFCPAYPSRELQTFIDGSSVPVFSLFEGSKFKWKLNKLNYTGFEKPDLNHGWTIKSEPGATFQQ